MSRERRRKTQQRSGNETQIKSQWEACQDRQSVYPDRPMEEIRSMTTKLIEKNHLGNDRGKQRRRDCFMKATRGENVLLPVFMSTHLFKYDGRYLTMKMELNKTQPGGIGPEHLVFITACQTSFFLLTWGLGTGGSSVSFSLCTMPSITPVDPESIIIPVCVCDSPRPRHWPTS